jgi:hypothetical protein
LIIYCCEIERYLFLVGTVKRKDTTGGKDGVTDFPGASATAADMTEFF